MNNFQNQNNNGQNFNGQQQGFVPHQQNFNQMQDQNQYQQQQQNFQQQMPQQGQQQYNPQQQYGQQPQQNFQQQGQSQQEYRPQNNVMQGSFTIANSGIKESNNSNYESQKNPNVTPVPSGPQIGRIYSIVDVGSHESNYKGNISYKRKLKIAIEFPSYLQQKYLDKPDLSPTKTLIYISPKTIKHIVP